MTEEKKDVIWIGARSLTDYVVKLFKEKNESELAKLERFYGKEKLDGIWQTHLENSDAKEDL